MPDPAPLPEDPASLSLLSPMAVEALRRAQSMPLSYGVRVYVHDDPTPRVLVVLGEAHMKMQAAEEAGHEVVRSFGLRGVETAQIADLFAGRALRVVIHGPRLLLRAITFGAVKGSTITIAKAIEHGATVEIERTREVPLALHVASVYVTALFAVFWLQFATVLLGAPSTLLTALMTFFNLHLLGIVPAILLRRHPWHWILQPAVAILTVRDTLMADGTARMFAEHPDAKCAVVVMGRAHLGGYEREIVTHHGFRRIAF